MDAEDVYFLENTYMVRRWLAAQNKKRSYWVNPIFEKRHSLGEFNHLHSELESDPQKFFDYYRMRPTTFKYILIAIDPIVTKESNFRETISPAERLCDFKVRKYV